MLDDAPQVTEDAGSASRSEGTWAFGAKARPLSADDRLALSLVARGKASAGTHAPRHQAPRPAPHDFQAERTSGYCAAG